ncbi:MAG: alpha/beta fold hydrolase [Myxococcota bacterium]
MDPVLPKFALALGIISIGGCTHASSQTERLNEKAALASEQSQEDVEAIETLMNTLFAAVDRRDWDSAAAKMHDSVYVDYSTLGGEVGPRSPSELTRSWSSLLPGFERTVHNPHRYAIWVAGDRATATLDAIASHYLQVPDGENHWSVFVGYDTEFVKVDGDWKLARLDVSLYDQTGNTRLPQRAVARVAAGETTTLAKSSEATQAVERFFEALEARDIEQLMATLEPDIVQHMPFAPEGFPQTLKGIDAMRQQYSGVMDYVQSYERLYYPTNDPQTVMARFAGTVTTSEGKPYNNSYVGIYTIGATGKISNFVEQFNPKILLSGWPGLSTPHFSVHKAGARRESGVTLRPVDFDSQGEKLRGHLFVPPNYDPQRRYPAVVVTGSWTSVKEQMPDEYASLLAATGVLALTFDFRGFGASEGQPRQFEDSTRKIEDIRAAVDFLAKRTDVETIAGLGVCASSGYIAHAAAQDPRISRLVLIAPWLHNAEMARALYDARPGGTVGLLRAAEEAKTRYETTGQTQYALAASELDALSAMYVPQNAFDYYLNPAKAAGSHYANLFAIMSWKPWLTFDGISVAKDIEQPVFIVHSEHGAVPQGTKAFYSGLRGQKDIVWLDQFNQQQLYMDKEAVHTAVQEVADYLMSTHGQELE